ncbi:MAG TPA: glycosyltransferase family 1 protein [Patescibacteria group bacterium]
MQVAIDISPLESGHSVRGVGFYLRNLKAALEKGFSNISFTFFTQTKNIPNKADLVHFPYFDPFFLTLPWLGSNKKTIVTVHDLTPLIFPESFPIGIKGKIKWMIQRYLLKKVDAIITDSNSSKKDIIKILNFPEEKIFVAYLAAAHHFRVLGKEGLKKIKEKYDLPDNFLLYVGDVTPNKNLPRLIKAVLCTNVPLVMVGKALVNENIDLSNPWNKDLKEVLELAKGKDQIRRLGFVEDEELVGLYNLANAFIMPSLYEGFGLPLLEAMACGCPVITTNNGSIPEVVGDGAYIVDGESINDIEKGIREVIGNKSLAKKLSEKGLIMSKNFSWENTAKETVDVYTKVVSS